MKLFWSFKYTFIQTCKTGPSGSSWFWRLTAVLKKHLAFYFCWFKAQLIWAMDKLTLTIKDVISFSSSFTDIKREFVVKKDTFCELSTRSVHWRLGWGISWMFGYCRLSRITERHWYMSTFTFFTVSLFLQKNAFEERSLSLGVETPPVSHKWAHAASARVGKWRRISNDKKDYFKVATT